MDADRWLSATLTRAAEHDEPPAAPDWEAVTARAAVLAPPVPRRRRRRRLAVSGLAAAAVAAAALLVLTRDVDEHGGLTPIQRAQAALAVPADGVLHIRIEFGGSDPAGTHTWNEIWQSADSFRSLSPGIEGGRTDDGQDELYDADTDTITVRPVPRPLAGQWWWSDIYTGDVRALMARGDVRLAGHQTVHGIDCLRIEAANPPGTSNTFFVDAQTYRPVAEQTTTAAGTQEVWFRIWEVLPADGATVRLTDLRALHPQAKIVHASADQPPPTPKPSVRP